MAKIFTGKDTLRPELDRLLAFVREGDTVVVLSMNRLARNLDDLRRIVQDLTKRRVRIEFVKECLTFTGEDSPMANLMPSVMGAFAEFERALLRERQREGITTTYTTPVIIEPNRTRGSRTGWHICPPMAFAKCAHGNGSAPLRGSLNAAWSASIAV